MKKIDKNELMPSGRPRVRKTEPKKKGWLENTKPSRDSVPLVHDRQKIKKGGKRKLVEK